MFSTTYCHYCLGCSLAATSCFRSLISFICFHRKEDGKNLIDIVSAGLGDCQCLEECIGFLTIIPNGTVFILDAIKDFVLTPNKLAIKVFDGLDHIFALGSDKSSFSPPLPLSGSASVAVRKNPSFSLLRSWQSAILAYCS